jgi:hypothetical protein
MPNHTPNTVIYNQNGLELQASCLGGSVSLTATPQGIDHNIVENTVFDNLAGSTSYYSNLNVPAGTAVDLLNGKPGVDDFNGLLTVRTNQGGLLTFIQWWATGGNNFAQGTCLVGGTASY